MTGSGNPTQSFSSPLRSLPVPPCCFLKFKLIELRFEDSHRILLVIQLGPGFLVLYHNSSRMMPQPDCSFDLVHILSAGTARPVGLPGYIGRVDRYLDIIINKRRDKTDAKVV